ncbi:MAG: hypothetical protein DMG74_03195 [Acidobacteria bacterium]|nr:MAG: hypothetical protein DMG74_03195 [Acidobacteriota bacterium]
MKKQIERLAVTTSEAAEMIGVSLRTIQNYIRGKQLRARKIGGRTVVEVCHLKAFLGVDRASAADLTASRNNHQTRQDLNQSVPLPKMRDPEAG